MRTFSNVLLKYRIPSTANAAKKRYVSSSTIQQKLCATPLAYVTNASVAYVSTGGGGG